MARKRTESYSIREDTLRIRYGAVNATLNTTLRPPRARPMRRRNRRPRAAAPGLPRAGVSLSENLNRNVQKIGCTVCSGPARARREVKLLCHKWSNGKGSSNPVSASPSKGPRPYAYATPRQQKVCQQGASPAATKKARRRGSNLRRAQFSDGGPRRLRGAAKRRLTSRRHASRRRASYRPRSCRARRR